jgi:ribosome-binding ATPase YchF (GTP1/OBG family)
MPNPVCATDHGKFTRTGIVRTAGQLLVDRFQRRRVNMHDCFTVVNDWLREFFITRRYSKLVQNGSIHTDFLVLFILDSASRSLRKHSHLEYDRKEDVANSLLSTGEFHAIAIL